MLKAQTIKSFVIVHIAIIILPLALVLVYGVFDDLRRSAGLEEAHRNQEQSKEVLRQFKVFLNGVIDAVDIGHLGEDNYTALDVATKAIRKLAAADRERSFAEELKSLESISATLGQDRSIAVILPLKAAIGDLDRALTSAHRHYETTEYEQVEANIEAARYRRSITLAAATLSLCLTVYFVLLLVRKLTRPLVSAVSLAERIAAGDLTIDSKPFKDDIGNLLHSLHTMNDRLCRIIKGVKEAAGAVAGSANTVEIFTRKVQSSAQAQHGAIDTATSSSTELSMAIRTIAGDAGHLGRLTACASASSMEISAALAEILEMTGRLDTASDQTNAAVDEIAASSRQVAGNVKSLVNTSGSVLKAADRISGMALQIVDRSQEQELKAGKSREEAVGLGLRAITKTKERMTQIQTEVTETGSVLKRMGGLSGEINRIVSIIEEITEKTKLLALNASILAAQAGIHGKGFAVVASEVKGLAVQTAKSTREVAAMVKQVQDSTAHAMNAAQRSSKVVEEGVLLSLEAEVALNSLIKHNDLSLDNASEMARLAEDQRAGVETMTAGLRQMEEMIKEISQATNSQHDALKDIHCSTEYVREFALTVRKSVETQSIETKNISHMVYDIQERAQVIAGAVAEQESAADTIVQSMETVLSEARGNIAKAEGMSVVVKTVQRQADQLQDEVDVFRL